MRAPRPQREREPDCVHGYGAGAGHPASACRICKDGPELREWKRAWAAWLAENPNSPEARWVAEMDRRWGK